MTGNPPRRRDWVTVDERVTEIRLYPVKGLRGGPVEAAVVEPWGLAGDRRWMVVDAAGRFLTQRQHPTMATLAAIAGPAGLTLSRAGAAPLTVPLPDAAAGAVIVTVWKDRVPALPADAAAEAFLTAALGVPARLVYMADPATARPVDRDFGAAEDRVSFADGFPLLVTTGASLDDLNDRLAAPVPMDRFRPNLVVDGATAWSEDRWTRLRIGEVVFAAVKPCARCVVTTVDQATGTKAADNEPIRAMQGFRRDARGQVLFGQNLIPRGTGRVRRGDPVEILG